MTPELGRLAKWLRAVGYDAAVFTGDIPDLLAKATGEHRVILTRRCALRSHRGTPVVWIKDDQLPKQLRAVPRACRIGPFQKNLFTRCLLCNVAVKQIAKAKMKEKVPPYVYQTQKAFSYCPSCRRIYWAATHWYRASKFLKGID
ncbi:MAG: Mut7-C RNAse domain-containing protein, partial [Candidatus Omnitrophota bacterium]